jgi:hypothetical protein
MSIVSAEYRITLGTVLIVWAMSIATVGAIMESVNPDTTIVATAFTVGAGLLGVGIWKKKQVKSEAPITVGKEN